MKKILLCAFFLLSANQFVQADSTYVKRIFVGQEITIGPTSGKENIVHANDVFHWIHPDFEKYGCDVPEEPTKKIPVACFDIVRGGTSTQIFKSFGKKLDRLCFTQNQIKIFVKEHPDLIRIGSPGTHATLFLFKKQHQFFLAQVGFRDEGFSIRPFSLSDDFVWDATFHSQYGIVIPKL